MSHIKSREITRREIITGAVGAGGLVAIGATAVCARPAASQSLQEKKVLVAIGDFSEGMETYYMVYRLMEEGITPVVAANAETVTRRFYQLMFAGNPP